MGMMAKMSIKSIDRETFHNFLVKDNESWKIANIDDFLKSRFEWFRKKSSSILNITTLSICHYIYNIYESPFFLGNSLLWSCSSNESSWKITRNCESGKSSTWRNSSSPPKRATVAYQRIEWTSESRLKLKSNWLWPWKFQIRGQKKN